MREICLTWIFDAKKDKLLIFTEFFFLHIVCPHNCRRLRQRVLSSKHFTRNATLKMTHNAKQITIFKPQKWHLNACNMLLMPFYCLSLNLLSIMVCKMQCNPPQHSNDSLAFRLSELERPLSSKVHTNGRERELIRWSWNFSFTLLSLLYFIFVAGTSISI